MYRVVMGKRVPVTIPNVEIACHNDCIVQVDEALQEELESSLITVGVDVDHEVGVLVTVKC